MGIFRGLRPDITPAQVVALVGSVVALLVSFGVDLSAEQRDSILTLVGILAGLLLVSDAGLRVGRNVANP